MNPVPSLRSNNWNYAPAGQPFPLKREDNRFALQSRYLNGKEVKKAVFLRYLFALPTKNLLEEPSALLLLSNRLRSHSATKPLYYLTFF